MTDARQGLSAQHGDSTGHRERGAWRGEATESGQRTPGHQPARIGKCSRGSPAMKVSSREAAPAAAPRLCCPFKPGVRLGTFPKCPSGPSPLGGSK